MKLNCRDVRKFFLAVLFAAGFGNAQATLVNGDFQAGGLSNWTAFTTANGTLGSGKPAILNFDVAGNGFSSSALGLSVGYFTPPCAFPGLFCPRPTEGGGVRQSVVFSGGMASLQADVAVANSTIYGGYNGDGGTFSLLLEGLLLDSFSVGQITAGTVQRGHLDFTSFVSAGVHSLEILVTRQYAESGSLVQYIDNVSVSSVPEPTTTSLLGLGILALVFLKRKGRTLTE